MQSEIGVMVLLFVTPMFHNMGLQWAGFLLAMLSVLISLIPFVFYIYVWRLDPCKEQEGV